MSVAGARIAVGPKFVVYRYVEIFHNREAIIVVKFGKQKVVTKAFN